MDAISYKTVSANKATVKKEWVIVDAKDQVLGRFASAVAMVLRGKHRPDYTPHVDCGDNVIGSFYPEKVKAILDIPEDRNEPVRNNCLQKSLQLL